MQRSSENAALLIQRSTVSEIGFVKGRNDEPRSEQQPNGILNEFGKPMLDSIPLRLGLACTDGDSRILRSVGCTRQLPTRSRKVDWFDLLHARGVTGSASRMQHTTTTASPWK